MNLTDGIILFLVVLSAIFGYRKNLFRNFFDFMAVLLSLAISTHYYGTFAEIVVKIPGISHIIGFINSTIISRLSALDTETKFTLDSLKQVGLGDDFAIFFEKGSFFREKSELVFSELSLGMVTNVLALVLLFVISLFIVHFISGLAENANRMPGLMGVDRFGGTIFAVLRGFTYGLVVALIVYNLAGFFNSGLVYDLYHKSSIATMYYESGIMKAIMW